MITLSLLTIIAVCIVLTVLVGGLGFLVTFGDVIFAIWCIVMLTKLFCKKKD